MELVLDRFSNLIASSIEPATCTVAGTRTWPGQPTAVEISGSVGTSGIRASPSLAPGSYSLAWDGRKSDTPVPTGIYFVRWVSDGATMSRRLVLVR